LKQAVKKVLSRLWRHKLKTHSITEPTL
jgi:hypothetical protein